MLKAGKLSQASIARQLGVSEAAVSQWQHQLNKGGVRALHLKQASGRPAKLSTAQLRPLVRLLKRGAVANGFETERWTQSRIQQLIKRTFQVSYHTNYIGRLMKQLSWSVQKPETRAIERDEDAIRAWLSHDWNRIKKARRIGADIVFVDAPAPTWAPRGRTPVLKRVGKYRRESSTMAGISVSGKLFKRHFRKSIKGKHVVTGLKQLDRQIPGKKIVVWDQSRIHRAKPVKAYLAANAHILVETLPTYAPELNPEEYCHGHAKQRAKNYIATSVADMRKPIDRDFASLRRQPDVLLSFFHHAGLSLKQLW